MIIGASLLSRWRKVPNHANERPNHRATTLDPAIFERPSSPVGTILPDYTSLVQLPGYSPYPRPTRPLIYTFSEWTGDRMYLMPPVDAPPLFPARGPMYNISAELNLNPLIPLSCVTSVQRCSGGPGSFIGCFEISLHRRRELVAFGDETLASMSEHLRPVNEKDTHWLWSSGDLNLRWDCRSVLDDGTPICNCYSVDDFEPEQLASFIPQPLHPDGTGSLPPATLTVWPDGHQYLDEILFSALILERKRTLRF